MLAESWETPDDGRTWIFQLREGVTWHDGQPFTAADVVFSLNLYANPNVASPWSSKLNAVDGYGAFQDGSADALSGVTALDDSTVQIVLTSAQPAWVNLQLIAISVVPMHILGDVAPDEIRGHRFWINRVGTGPFVWNAYRSDQFVEIVSNPDYFMGAPKLDRIVYQIFADIPSLVTALELQEVDAMSYEGGGIPIPELPRLQALNYLTVLPDFSAGLPTYIQINLDDPRFSDVRVRQAILHAIDRQAIIDTIKSGTGELSNTIFPHEWARADDLEPYAFDPEMARSLLAEAGWDSSDSIDFIYYYRDQMNVDSVTAIQSFLADVGINIVPRQLDPASINQVYADGTFQLGLFANGMGLDPSQGAGIVTCNSRPLALGYCNEEVDRLFEQGLQSADRDVRAEAYKEISRIVNRELPKAWLWNEVRPLAFNNRVVGLPQSFVEQGIVIFNHAVYNQVEQWYVAE